MDLEIAGNAALVTASSSGLGKASAAALAREGVDVMINGRDASRLEEALDDIERVATGDVRSHQADITDAEQVDALLERTISEFGRLDHLVTSAGGPPSGPFLDIPVSAWYDTYDQLVMSVVRTIRGAVPHLREDGGGTIVTITSRSVKEAVDSLVLSNAVRMSVVGLEKTLSRELAPGIRVNAVLPGSHATARVEELVQQAVDRGDFSSYEEGLAARANNIPRGRLGDPMELGDAVAFLSSPRASFISGVALPIDGGSGRSNL